MEHSKNVLEPVNNPTYITPEGKEVNDPVSMTDTDGDGILDKVRMMRNPLQFIDFMQGVDETVEDMNDFDVEDDFHDPRFEDSPYMEQEFPEKRVKEVVEEVKSKKEAESVDKSKKEAESVDEPQTELEPSEE